MSGRTNIEKTVFKSVGGKTPQIKFVGFTIKSIVRKVNMKIMPRRSRFYVALRVRIPRAFRIFSSGPNLSNHSYRLSPQNVR